MRGAFSHTGTEHWKNVTLTVTNACDALTNLDGVVIRFQDSQAIDDIGYTVNGHTAYPDIAMTSR